MVKLNLRLGPRQGDGALESRRSWCLSAKSRTSLREDATIVQNAIRAVAPGASLMRRRRLKIGSRTAPAVLESGWPSITATGVRIPRPRPRKRARSVSNWAGPTTSPSTTAICAAHSGKSPVDPRTPCGQNSADARRRTPFVRTDWRRPDERRRPHRARAPPRHTR